MTEGNKYQIKAVSRLTGLTPDTLRAWERRYGAIAPDRDEAGVRIYSEHDVERLRLLQRAVEAGHSIGRIATLPLDELRGLSPLRSGAMASRGQPDVVERILDAIKRFEYAEADRELGTAAVLMTSQQLVYRVALPLMKEVGDRWAHRVLGAANEHLASALLRNLLGTLLRTTPTSRPARLLLTTPVGEAHEMGLLSVALLAAAHGYSVCYLGPDLPVHEIAYAAIKSRADVVGLSLVYVPDPLERAREIRNIDEALPATVQLWLGGAGVNDLAAFGVPARARTFLTLSDLEAGLFDLEQAGT